GIAALLVLPTLLASLLAWNRGFWAPVVFLVAEVIAYGAFISSLGLALATWVPRLGRAVALCVAVDVFLTVGALFIVPLLIRGPTDERLLAVSPFAGPAIMTGEASGELSGPRYWSAGSPMTLRSLFASFDIEFIVIAAYSLAALGLLHLTFRSFDACLGRV